MKHAVYFAGAVALALVASPAVAQSNTMQSDHDRATMQDNGMMRHDMSRDRHMSMRHEMSRDRHMRMHGRMSEERIMRWCHSMSHRRMMMNPRCRSLMHTHHWDRRDRMHHM
jgi:hypothetical protein